MAESQLYTPAQVAKLLSVKTGTVREWLIKGQLEGVKLPGGDWRVRQEALDKLLKREQQATKEARQ